MKHEKLSQALDQISDRHIREAAKEKRRPYWLGAIAAVLAVVILALTLTQPMAISATAVSLASDPRISDRPDPDDYASRELWMKAYSQWDAERNTRSETASQALNSLSPFFTAGSAQFLTGSQQNTLWSPANAYLGLAMLSELTSGSTQQQLLTLLGAGELTALRHQAEALWETVYTNNGKEICTLANSLWLENGLEYRQEALEALSYHYYASVYKGDLGSADINKAITAWLNNNTGGLLDSYTKNVELPQEAVLSLYSTLFFQSKWAEEFSASRNISGIFHAPSGDRDATYMTKERNTMNYYWGDTFGAVSLFLKNGSRMWFILPDEDQSPASVLKSGEYMELVIAQEWENSKFMKVNLSVPKFDVSGSQDLKEGLWALGVTDVFSQAADFTAITSSLPVFITSANQAVRVQIDEQGVTAAAYIELPGAGSPAPPDEIIDFILDRPFLFVITNDNVPLIAGVVNEP